jgi:hypothetical protein
MQSWIQMPVPVSVISAEAHENHLEEILTILRDAAGVPGMRYHQSDGVHQSVTEWCVVRFYGEHSDLAKITSQVMLMWEVTEQAATLA